MNSQIILTNSIESYAVEFAKDKRARLIITDEFKIENSKEAISEAYISSDVEKFVILGAHKFNIPAQNSLLKVLEEPPKNITFIIITNSKSALLATIKSRLPIIDNLKKEELEEINFDYNLYDLKNMYEIIHLHKKSSKKDAKEFIEALLLNISTKVTLKQTELEIFSNSIKLLELNSRPINVITNVLLMLLEKKFSKKV